MKFSNILNNYIDIIGCTAKELAEVSSISTSVLSRYRRGDRIPKYNSKQYNQLMEGLIILIKKYDVNIKIDIIKNDFEKCLNGNNIDINIFRDNLNLLIDSLSINVSDLAKYIGFDSSYISKIRKGVRTPHHLDDFAKGIVRYVVDNYSDINYLDIISSVVMCDINDIVNKDDCFKVLINWIGTKVVRNNSIVSFLTKLDDFELNDYIKSIKFDKLKIPTMPIQIPKSKTYYGIEGFKNSQIDTLKSIVLSKSCEDVFFYSNMSMIEGSRDISFTKNFMIGLAVMLKKGIHLNMVHNLDRPWKELMLGLEGWIPLYMTGQISPYYFKNNSNYIYSQMECVGGTVALSGTSLTGNLESGKFYVTNKKEEVNYYKKNAKILLDKASSLMDIYNEHEYDKFIQVLDNSVNIDGVRRNIYSTLPIYTISDDLLNRILDRNNVNSREKKLIIECVSSVRERFLKILKKDKIVDEISVVSKDEFNKSNISLSLSCMFYDKKILYTYDEYIEHIELIKKYNNMNYSYKINNSFIFKNINIHIIDKSQVIISKENTPSIHFVIYHPKLIDSIEKFEVPIKENNYIE